MKQSQRIVKNLFAGGISTILGGLLQLAAVAVIARCVTVSEFGAYSFMMAFAFVLERLADGGLNSILIRDMAVAPDEIGEILGGALTLCVLYIVAGTVLMIAIIPFFHFDTRISVLTGVMGFARLEHVFVGCYGAVLLSQEKYELHGIGFVLHKLFLLVLSVAALAMGTGITGVVIAHALSIIAPWILYRHYVSSRFARIHMQIDVKAWGYLIRESIPVGGAAVLRLFAEQADILVLTAIAGTTAVGLFSGPSRMASGLRYLPQTLMLALFPLYSRAATEGSAQIAFGEAYLRGAKSFMLLAFPLALLCLMHPEPLTVGLLGPQYRPAVPAMRLMSVTVWLLFAAAPYAMLLTALGRQSFLFISTAAALVLRVALDIAFTSRIGFLGPCVGMNISEGLLLVAFVGCIWKAGFPLPFAKILWPAGLASMAMGAVLYLTATKSLLVLMPFAAIGSVLYFAVLYLVGAFSEAEIARFREGLGFLRPFLNPTTPDGQQPAQRPVL